MGILDKIKSVFGNNEQQPEQIPVETGSDLYKKIIDDAYSELLATGIQHWWAIKISEIDSFKNHILTLSDTQKVGFIIWSVKEVHTFSHTPNNRNHDNIKYQKNELIDNCFRYLLKTKLVLGEEDIENILESFYTYSKYSTDYLLHWPLNLLVNQVEKQYSSNTLSPKLQAVFQVLHQKIQGKSIYGAEKEKQKMQQKIELLLYKNEHNSAKIKPTFFLAQDEFGIYANHTIEEMEVDSQQVFFKIMLQAQKASGGKPSGKYLNEIQQLYKEYGADKYKLVVNNWMEFIINLKEKTENHTYEYNNHTHTYSSSEFIATVNTDMIKGFIWSLVHFFDKSTLFNIARLAERSYRKITGKGPAAAAIGNACLYVLANVKGMDGISHLSRLRMRIKQASTQAVIEKYLTEAAKEQGISLHDIEDLAVDDYGLVQGKKEYELEGFKAIVEIAAIGKTSLRWFKPDGTEQKAIPAVVKDKQAARLKKLKETIKQIELTTAAQRDRLDRMFISNRSIKATDFDTNYLQHGLMQFVAKKIIWNVEQAGNKCAVFNLNNQWVNNAGEIVPVSFTEDTMVSLWHPVFTSVEDVKNWRAFMLQYKIVQPLKQAYREIYFLTDAEINTVSYSNRMAAHILKQHQFNSLAKARGWSYALQGGWDGGFNGYAAHLLKEYNLRAEFWVNEVGNADAMNDVGIWLYMATDQVRFTDTTNNLVKDLIDIPAIVFSEVMRDVDLFVGVASVGNDPNWRDSGSLPAGYNTYWESYSFGDLNEVAKTRKSILEGLVPRLKIAKVAELKDKFLVVKGKLRTYKIHIGSTNILMDPTTNTCVLYPTKVKKMPQAIFIFRLKAITVYL